MQNNSNQQMNTGDTDFDQMEKVENLFAFFELLLKVDKRVNPQFYKQNNQEHYD